MPRYLVTGGAGFIGSHLCDRLLADGHTVRVIDDLSTGKPENLPVEAEFLHASIADSASLDSAFKDVDGCFHLAAIASVERSCEAWLATHQINLSASVQVFNAAKTMGVPVVYASSAAIYGNNPAIPLAETAPLAPLSPYGADKAGMELQAQAGAASFDLASTGLRFFNVYGPRQDPLSPYSGVISIFAQRLAQNQDLAIHGDGEQTRDFVFVADVVEYLVRAMATNTAGVARVFNVCTGNQTSVAVLANSLQRLLNSASKISHTAPRVGDIRHSAGNPQRVIEALGHRAAIGLDEGLKRLLNLPA